MADKLTRRSVRDHDFIDSPLATKESRDRLARKPLRPETMPHSSPKSRGKKSDSNESPPNAQHKTSSPDPTKTSPADHTPSLSIIVNDNQSSRRLRSDAKRCQEALSDEDKDENDGQEHAEESDDERQPSATITKKTTTTPKRTTSAKARNIITETQSLVIPDNSSPSAFCSGIVIALVASLVILLVNYEPFQPTSLESNNVNWDQVQVETLQRINALKSEFPQQPPETWKMIRASLRRIFIPEPIQPSVLLLVTNDKSDQVGDCLALKVATIVQEVLNKTQSNEVIEAKSLMTHAELLDTASRQLQDRGSMVLHHIQRLEAQVAMGLHAICDNERAPSKQASIIMTLKASANQDNLEDRAMDVLRQAWQDHLDIDRFYPIFSRIAGFLVEVKEEIDVPC